MSPASRSILFNCALLISVIAVARGDTTGTSRKRSVVLKDPNPQVNLFHLKTDRSMDEIWDGFMLMKKANSGDPVAEHELGIRYLTGNGFSPDTARAAYWIRKAAEQNLTTAHYNYGILLNNGLGVEWNPFEAYRHFQYAAEHGLPEGEYAFGLQLTDDLVARRNYPEAYRWIKMAADSGYRPANEILAEFKKRGINVTNSFREDSVAAHKKPDENSRATAGSQAASPVLHPVFLDFGTDSVREPSNRMLLEDALMENHVHADTAHDDSVSDDTLLNHLTLQSLQQAAEWGSPEALTLIGRLYDQGIHVKKDLVQASTYYVRATRFDAPWAPILLWTLTHKEEYFPLLKKRVEENNPTAAFTWAELVSFGFDHQLTENQALELLQKASAQDYPEAVVELGTRYFTGTQGPANKEKAVALLKRAQFLGNREATIRLSTIDLMGTHHTGTDSTLFENLRNGSDKGSVLAQAMLGYCYEKGKGVAANLPEAVRLYRSAAQRGSRTAYDVLRDLYDRIRPKDPAFQIPD